MSFSTTLTFLSICLSSPLAWFIFLSSNMNLIHWSLSVCSATTLPPWKALPFKMSSCVLLPALVWQNFCNFFDLLSTLTACSHVKKWISRINALSTGRVAVKHTLQLVPGTSMGGWNWNVRKRNRTGIATEWEKMCSILVTCKEGKPIHFTLISLAASGQTW